LLCGPLKTLAQKASGLQFAPASYTEKTLLGNVERLVTDDACT